MSALIMHRTDKSPWATAAATIFLTVAGMEFVRIGMNMPWTGFKPLASHMAGAFLGPLCAAAGFTLLLKNWKRKPFSLAAWMVVWPAALLMVGHGMLTTWASASVAAPRWGLVMVASGLAQFLLLRKAFGRGLLVPVRIPRLRHA